MDGNDVLPIDLAGFQLADLVKTPHNARLYTEVQNLKKLINDLVNYQLAHPKNAKPATREEMDMEITAKVEIEKREKYIRAQLSIIKTLYRQSVLKVREEKAKTSDDRTVNDALILGLHNLKYEEQSLRSEISAAENYEYVLLSAPRCIADPTQSQVHETPAHIHRRLHRTIPRAQKCIRA
jgi:THO complex subunit 5